MVLPEFRPGLAWRAAHKNIRMVIALLVLFTSPGPAFVSRCYRRQNGQTVDLWEFRTECWRQWEPTTVGVYLRRANMHRLPALVNVIKGDVEPGEPGRRQLPRQ